MTKPTATQSKLVATDGDSADLFGWSVELSDETAFVGAYRDEDSNGDIVGSTYAFKWSNGRWTQEAKLTAADGSHGDGFGWALAVDGNTVLIGAPGDDHPPDGDAAGSAYVFERSNGDWSQTTKFSAADGDTRAQFGSSVALDRGTALIGEPGADESTGENVGAAYAFERSVDGWSQVATLVAENGDSGDRFGWSVALDGETAIIGANKDEDPNGEGAGSAYVFEWSGGGWVQSGKLAADDGESEDGFGWSVALDAGTALIGAPGVEEPNGDKAGAAYIFEEKDGGWTQMGKLVAEDGDQLDLFGNSVALASKRGIVGAYRDDDPNGIKAGSAYVFERIDGAWSQVTKLAAGDGDSKDRFGRSVTLDGGTVLIGAHLDEDPNGYSAGAAYVFEV